MDDLILAMTKADILSARMVSDWQVEQKNIFYPIAKCDKHHLDSVGEVLVSIFLSTQTTSQVGVTFRSLKKPVAAQHPRISSKL